MYDRWAMMKSRRWRLPINRGGRPITQAKHCSIIVWLTNTFCHGQQYGTIIGNQPYDKLRLPMRPIDCSGISMKVKTIFKASWYAHWLLNVTILKYVAGNVSKPMRQAYALTYWIWRHCRFNEVLWRYLYWSSADSEIMININAFISHRCRPALNAHALLLLILGIAGDK